MSSSVIPFVPPSPLISVEIVVHRDIQGKIVHWLLVAFCKEDVKVTPAIISEVTPLVAKNVGL